MDEPSESSQDVRRGLHNPDRGDISPISDDASEEGQSSNKYRRIDREGVKAAPASDNANASRFLFVDSFSTSSRPRSDQRAINAHIQQTAHRNRKHAAQKQKPAGAANIGRNRRAPVLQPRPIEPQRIAAAPVASAQQEPFEESPPSSWRSSPITSPTGSVRSESSTPDLAKPVPQQRTADVSREQLIRLRHYSNVRRPEVESAIIAQREEQHASIEIVRRTSPDNETSSVKSMLSQILQRLDAGYAGHSIQPPPNLSLSNTTLDPFNISTVYITPSMNTVLRHCE